MGRPRVPGDSEAEGVARQFVGRIAAARRTRQFRCSLVSSVRDRVDAPYARERSIEGGDQTVGTIAGNVDDGRIDEAQASLILTPERLDSFDEELGAGNEVELAGAEQQLGDLLGNPGSTTGHEHGHHLEKDVLQQQAPAPFVIEKPPRHFSGRFVVGIPAVVVRNEEARVEDDHWDRSSGAISDGVDLFAQMIVPIRVGLGLEVREAAPAGPALRSCEPGADGLVHQLADGCSTQRGARLELPVDVLIKVANRAIHVLIVTQVTRTMDPLRAVATPSKQEAEALLTSLDHLL